MEKQWLLATRRLWVGVLIRTFFAGAIVWPAVAAVALLVSHFLFPNASSAFFYLTAVLGTIVNLLAMLWAIRQAIQKIYPEGMFKFVANE